MTHTERVLELLSDGRPHSHHEGYALRVMLHSRVADLRRQGHEIRCWRENGTYWYRLSLSERDKPCTAGSGSLSLSEAGDTAGGARPGSPSLASETQSNGDPPASLVIPGQLTIEAA